MKFWQRFLRYQRIMRYFENWPLYFNYRRSVKKGQERDYSTVLHFRTRNRFILGVPVYRMHLFEEIFACHIYWPSFWGKPLDNKNPIVIDIGANIGLFSFFALCLFPGARIIAIEPIEENFSWLKDTIEANKLSSLVSLRQCALSSQRGFVDLYLHEEGHFPIFSSILSVTDRKIPVPTKTLVDIFEEEKIDRCDWIKLDCEGAEYEILYNCPGSLFKTIHRLSIEAHRGEKPGHTAETLQMFLTKKGYVVKRKDISEQSSMIYALQT
ncbi:SAM-dependent methyltransferase [Methylacidiphilum infernorum V4]|uniref:SAM-dependent methyltransferase n=2 Tax=Candidatus Methylacidiphilum infernorum TaxID=511746 RepID=B3DUW8_METI4|nr:SAM-dependent methyltransferase [Methylacidiphilum infernorum V4]